MVSNEQRMADLQRKMLKVVEVCCDIEVFSCEIHLQFYISGFTSSYVRPSRRTISVFHKAGR